MYEELLQVMLLIQYRGHFAFTLSVRTQLSTVVNANMPFQYLHLLRLDYNMNLALD